MRRATGHAFGAGPFTASGFADTTSCNLDCWIGLDRCHVGPVHSALGCRRSSIAPSSLARLTYWRALQAILAAPHTRYSARNRSKVVDYIADSMGTVSVDVPYCLNGHESQADQRAAQASTARHRDYHRRGRTLGTRRLRTRCHAFRYRCYSRRCGDRT